MMTLTSLPSDGLENSAQIVQAFKNLQTSLSQELTSEQQKILSPFLTQIRQKLILYETGKIPASQEKKIIKLLEQLEDLLEALLLTPKENSQE